MTEPAAHATPTTARRDTSLLAVGSLVSGLLAYVFFALVTRTLGAGPAAPVAVLWAWWSFAGAAITFPVFDSAVTMMNGVARRFLSARTCRNSS